MSFYLYQDIINGEGTEYILRAKNKKISMRKLEKICPFGWDMKKLQKIKMYELTGKEFFKLLIKGMLRKDVFYT